jgi:hypothetical protein
MRENRDSDDVEEIDSNGQHTDSDADQHTDSPADQQIDFDDDQQTDSDDDLQILTLWPFKSCEQIAFMNDDDELQRFLHFFSDLWVFLCNFAQQQTCS